jgi:HAD superfamily hydrolase (TIGR01549 family)
MIHALLLDLDDTLLLNDMELFAPHYFRALLAKVGPLCAPTAFSEAMNAGVRAMMANDGRVSNAEAFAETFFPRLDCARETLLPVLDAFYAHEFEALRIHTQPDPQARPLVELAFRRGYRVAIATQPMFPRTAIQARLRWANVGAEAFPYAFITSYEVMGACKPHPHYFATLIERLGCAPEECLMVGDSVESDMPARTLGLHTFWVNRRNQTPQPGLADAQGSLGDLIHLIESGGIDAL